ncbi:D-alanine--D-alanine ligase [Oleiphilus sp. HI0071]|jgi:D-alanine-D-alanine ligase|nr:D-alanine--D-alanine ligase [Oleiphilus sp. HI0065]KZY82540.1 D-alanine--D-alanine ligase [Oleiphilus sp. HI0071]KZY92878.1 D-alanine--D-alanine ligase [Oleiphilus sp. HI0073]KZZ44755.1 D-alanine--D-alanine ligase [Oleiphilus sp. HI0118]KZZ50694.1 D-alanine--D-alanine ligase [Oleiphilus sp. HI0122]KZZ74402.1 D-alanine--D-alanine ligase [Oleiphilus sp. HI0130]KZZ78807.1 D-alanine--D-alanine ligase [Oleiphilus sp. HI0133]
MSYQADRTLIEALGKIAVVCGGCSAEREVSLNSGEAVYQAALTAGLDATKIDYQGDINALLGKGFDRVFLALHGRGGEDGVIQGVLESIGLPYTGSGVMGSALAMDKLRTKLLWQGKQLPTPQFGYVDKLDANLVSQLVGLIGFPMAVKPSREGSSIGVSKVSEQSQLDAALQSALELDQEVILEQWVDGEEYTVGILGEQTLPVIGLKAAATFYDYDAKYRSNETQYMLPSNLCPEDEQKISSLSKQAFDALACKGWGRVDVMRDRDGKFWLLEVNTIPGMTDHSLIPMAARHNGMSMPELVAEILKQTLRVGGLA